MHQPLGDHGEHQVEEIRWDGLGWVGLCAVLVSLPETRMFIFFQPGCMRMSRNRKSPPQEVGCYYLNGGHDHSSDCFKVFKVSTGAICLSRDMTWLYPRTPLVTAAAAGGGGRGLTAYAAVPTPPVLSKYVGVCQRMPYYRAATCRARRSHHHRLLSLCHHRPCRLLSPRLVRRRLECRQYHTKIPDNLSSAGRCQCRGVRG